MRYGPCGVDDPFRRTDDDLVDVEGAEQPVRRVGDDDRAGVGAVGAARRRATRSPVDRRSAPARCTTNRRRRARRSSPAGPRSLCRPIRPGHQSAVPGWRASPTRWSSIGFVRAVLAGDRPGEWPVVRHEAGGRPGHHLHDRDVRVDAHDGVGDAERRGLSGDQRRRCRARMWARPTRTIRRGARRRPACPR